MSEMKKVPVSEAYPPEEGCYLRGNDYSPVAVIVILNRRREETPEELEELVRVAVESGAALAGTLQTENIGFEKVICNIVANPNIRYILLCGSESPGHLTGESVIALIENDVDARKKILGTKAPTPYLFNIPVESIERFRKQIRIVECLNEGTPELIREVVSACYQEQATSFRDYSLHDIGAFPEPAICKKITWQVKNPEKEPKDEEERKQVDKFQAVVQVYKANSLAFPRYKPAAGRIHCPIDLFCAEETQKIRADDQNLPEYWGWAEHTQASVRIHQVSGAHITMLRTPHVKTLAARLQTLLSSTHARANRR
ncbi:MAG: tetrahydromethanopterin S-methyltransferase subunit A [bacterium]|nr:tetrahydromethanopterin S-methyltransferase subunit A [bacterium]